MLSRRYSPASLLAPKRMKTLTTATNS
jgi:hypothetical protein